MVFGRDNSGVFHMEDIEVETSHKWTPPKRMALLNPIGSMHGIFTYIWVIFMVNVGKYIPYMDPMGTGFWITGFS